MFGYGLSYSQFEISNLRLSRTTVSRNGSLTASVDVRNVAGPKGDEVVQLYLTTPWRASRSRSAGCAGSSA